MRDNLNQVDSYTIVKSYLVEKLLKEVNLMIKEGWVPQGGLVIDDINHYQAMVKIAPNNLAGDKDENENA